MPSENTQRSLERNRPPRVHLMTEVEENGAIVKKEVAFVTGVLADLAGDKKRAKKLKERDFKNIDKDNFDEILAGIAPELKLEVANVLEGGDSNLKVGLEFKAMEDFSPTAVARQVPALAKLLETRSKLIDLKGRADGRDDFEKLLEMLLKDADFRGKALKAVEDHKAAGDKAAGDKA